MKEKRTIQSVRKLIAAFFRDNRRMPSFAEMVDLLGVGSKSVVNFWIDKLVEAEILEKDDKGHLTFTKRSFAIPMVGSVQAGFPSPEEEALCDVISMDEYLVAKPEASFLLQVSGDSMIGEGIMAGDLVIVERGREPKSGDIVIAEVDGRVDHKVFQARRKAGGPGSRKPQISHHQTQDGASTRRGRHRGDPEVPFLNSVASTFSRLATEGFDVLKIVPALCRNRFLRR